VIEPILQDVALEVKESETIFRMNVATERSPGCSRSASSAFVRFS